MPCPARSLAPGDRWGPFADGLEADERLARLRVLAALVHVLTGERGAAAVAALHAAERDPDRAPAAHDAVMRLAALDMRRVLATYAALARRP